MSLSHSHVDRDYLAAMLTCVVLFFLFTFVRLRFFSKKKDSWLGELLRDLALAFFPLAVCILSWEFWLRGARREESETAMRSLLREHFADVAAVHDAGLARVRPKSSTVELHEFARSARQRLRILVPWFLDPTGLKGLLVELAAREGMEIQIVLLKPDSPFAAQRGRVIQPNQEDYGSQEVSRSLVALSEALGRPSKARVEVLVYDSLPSAFIAVADDRALLGWYLNMGTALDAPLLECELRRDGAPTTFGAVIEEEFKEILKTADVVDLGSVRKLPGKVVTYSAKRWAARPSSFPETLGPDEWAYIQGQVRAELKTFESTAIEQKDLGAAITLSMKSRRFTDAGAAWLSDPATGFGSLTSLDASGSAITDQGARKLSRPDTGLKGLVQLDLERTALTDDGFAAICSRGSGLGELEELYVSGTKVTDLGIQRIAATGSGLARLRVLSLENTAVTAEGVKLAEKCFPNARISR